MAHVASLPSDQCYDTPPPPPAPADVAPHLAPQDSADEDPDYPGTSAADDDPDDPGTPAAASAYGSNPDPGLSGVMSPPAVPPVRRTLVDPPGLFSPGNHREEKSL